MQGKSLWNAVDLISRAGAEINSLIDEIAKKMDAALKKESDYRVVEGEDDFQNDPSDSVTFTWFMQWGIKPKGKGNQKAIGNMSVQIVIWSDEDGIDPCGGIPRIEIAYMSSEKPDEDDFGAGTWLHNDSSDDLDWNSWGVSKDGRCLSFPKAKQDNDGVKWNDESDWIYAIPLFSVNNIENMEEFIVKPAIELLRGGHPDQILRNVPTFRFVIGKDALLEGRLD